MARKKNATGSAAASGDKVKKESGPNSGGGAAGGSKGGKGNGNGGGVKHEDSDEDEDDDDEDDDGEYEVEAILDTRLDKKKKNEFLVQWKNYDGQATWEPEENLSHSSDLIKAFHKKRKAEAEAKSSVNGRSTKAGSTSSSTRAAPPGKKAKTAPSSSTGAPNSTAQGTPNGTGAGAKPKGPNGRNKVHVSANAAGHKKRKAGSDDEHEEEPRYSQTHIDGVEKYEHLSSWEAVVETVDTVIRNDRNLLVVYLTMVGGERTSLSGEIAYSKCPQKVLQFYEAHLRWKTPTEE